MPRQKLTEEEKKIRREKMELKKRLQQKDYNLSISYNNYMERIKAGDISEPTYFFKVGDRVDFGNWEMVKILKVLEGGKLYLIFKVGPNIQYGKRVGLKKDMDYALWTDIRPYRTLEEKQTPEKFRQEDDVRLSYSQREVFSIFGVYYHHAGLDLNPDYQRELVWSEEQKVALIDSIFRNIDIGKFTIIRRKFREDLDHYYEILDGKQRIQALIDFYECRFKYKGKTYNDLHWRDRLHFQHYIINWAESEPMTDEQKYRYFLKLNVSGVPIAKKHIDKVHKMWENSKKKETKNG